MRIFAPGFLLGVCVIFLLRTLPANYVVVIALLLGAAVGYCLPEKPRWWLWGVVAGLGWSVLNAEYWLAKPILHELEDRPLTIEGKIMDLPTRVGRDSHFLIKTGGLPNQPALIKLSWYHDAPVLMPGEVWRLQVKLKQARGLSNPGGMDFEAWAVQQRLSAVGYVMQSTDNKRLTSHGVTNWFNQLRYFLVQTQHANLVSLTGAKFIPALTLGDRQWINAADWQVLQNTGTNHLVAIAGLHIGFVASLLFFLTKWGWVRTSSLALYFPAPQAGAVVALAGAIVYAGLAGFALPTQRAILMLGLIFIAIFFNRRIPAWHAYCTALFVVLLIDPAIVLAMSFWLSFSAVGVIIWMLTGRIKAGGKIKRMLSLQYGVSLGVLPCTLWFFQKASLISPLANLLVVPVVGWLVVPLALMGTVLLVLNHWLASQFLWLAVFTMQGVWWLLTQFASWPHMAINKAISSWEGLVFFSFGLALLLAPRGLPFKYLSLFLFLPLLFPQPAFVPPRGMNFTVLDVGQGLATVLQTQHHVLVFDTGPAQLGGFNAGEEVVLPYLRYEGIHQIDLLMISHGDNDHAGGAAAIMQGLQVKQVSTSVPEKFPANWRAFHCYQGQTWQWDGVVFEVLSPHPQAALLTSKNDHSCVLHVQAGQHSVLLTGDIEKESERELVDYKLPLQADILQIPHHGSRTSSTESFIQAVAPQYAIFSLGYHNRFHFPAKIVTQRYEAIHTQLYDTAASGALIFHIFPNAAIKPPIEYRKSITRWWRLKMLVPSAVLPDHQVK